MLTVAKRICTKGDEFLRPTRMGQKRNGQFPKVYSAENDMDPGIAPPQ